MDGPKNKKVDLSPLCRFVKRVALQIPRFEGHLKTISVITSNYRVVKNVWSLWRYINYRKNFDVYVNC